MKQTFAGVLVAFVFMIAAPTYAEEMSPTTIDREALITRIKELIIELQTLQGEMKKVQEEIRATVSDSLKEGMTHEDVREIQKLLATDPEIYPEGLTTGYYGRLTKEALKRFQKKHALEETGEINTETKALLEEYLSEKFGDTIPAGLLRAPGIQKKVEMRLKEGCDIKKGMGPLCSRLKADKEEKDEDEEKDDRDEDDDKDEDEKKDDDDDESEDN